MGQIKNPVDVVVENNPVTEEDRKQISKIIAYYKATGRKKLPAKKPNFHRDRRSITPKHIAEQTKSRITDAPIQLSEKEDCWK